MMYADTITLALQLSRLFVWWEHTFSQGWSVAAPWCDTAESNGREHVECPRVKIHIALGAHGGITGNFGGEGRGRFREKCKGQGVGAQSLTACLMWRAALNVLLLKLETALLAA